MAKFKKGDRVVVTEKSDERAGFTGTVVGYDHEGFINIVKVAFDNGHTCAGFSSGNSNVFEYKLELIGLEVSRETLLEDVMRKAAAVKEAEEKYLKALEALVAFK